MDKGIKEIFVIPESIMVHGKECVHYYKQWRAAAYRIDNHIHRVYVAVHPVSGEIREFDCKGPSGVVAKHAKNWGASQDDIDLIREHALELQKIKGNKGHWNAEWSRIVYGVNRRNATSKTVTMLQLKAPEVLDMFGRYYNTDEVRKILNERWQFAVPINDVKEFYTIHKDKIDRLRADYVLAGKETRLATDVGRMEVLSKIAWEWEQKFDKTKSMEVSKELRATIEQIRKEVKGDELKLTIDGKIDITATIQANKTVHEALQKLPINMIVIGLTAAKQGINPAQLIGSLANSYYSKFNGFNKLSDKGEINLPGEYIRSYNWDEIKMKHENVIEEAEVIEVYEQNIPELDKIIVIDKKQRMMDLLKGLKEETKD